MEPIHIGTMLRIRPEIAACGKILSEGPTREAWTTDTDSATCVPCLDAVSEKVLAKLQEQRATLEALQMRRMKVRLGTSDEPAGALEPRFFSHDPEGLGFETHESLEKARESAQAALDLARDYAGDSGWPEMVEDIAYGRIEGRVIETERMPWPEHLRRKGLEPDGDDGGQFDEFVDFRLEDFE